MGKDSYLYQNLWATFKRELTDSSQMPEMFNVHFFHLKENTVNLIELTANINEIKPAAGQ